MPFSCFLFHPRKSCEKHRKCSHTNVSNASVIRFSTPPAQTATFAFMRESGYTLGFRRRIAHSGSHGEARRFGWGWYHYPRYELHVHEHPRAGCQNGVLCRFEILTGRCSRRTQKAFGTAMCSCASLSRRRRGPAGLRNLFAFVKIGICTSCAQGLSACARQGGITTLGTLCMFSKRWTAACQKGLFAVF